MKNGILPDYRFVLQNLLSFSERDIKPADKVFDKTIMNKGKYCYVSWVKQSYSLINHIRILILLTNRNPFPFKVNSESVVYQDITNRCSLHLLGFCIRIAKGRG